MLAQLGFYDKGNWIEATSQLAVAIAAAFTVVGAFVRVVVVPWFRDKVVAPQVDRVLSSALETQRLVTYHLGSNGSTTPLRDRVLRVEDSLINARNDILELQGRGRPLPPADPGPGGH